MSEFDIVKDSSVWFDSHSFSAAHKRDPYIRIGIVKRAYFDKEAGDFRFHVEIQDRNDKIESNCRLLRKLGGVYNYEDVIHRGYKYSEKSEIADFSAKAGDIVLVAFMSGETRDGVILGGLTHPARKSILKVEDGPQYKSEFNGVETHINKDGEYVVTFKGQPTNIKSLEEAPSQKVPAAEYDKEVGSTFMKFDKTGSWELNDNAKEDKQFLKVDKKSGKVLFTAGKVEVVLNKKSEEISMKSKTLKIDATDKIAETTKDYSVTASSTVKIKSPKVAIGKDGVELLDQIVKAIEKLGMVKPISPIGPCTPLMATPEWPDVTAVKAKISEIKGSL